MTCPFRRGKFQIFFQGRKSSNSFQSLENQHKIVVTENNVDVLLVTLKFTFYNGNHLSEHDESLPRLFWFGNQSVNWHLVYCLCVCFYCVCACVSASTAFALVCLLLLRLRLCVFVLAVALPFNLWTPEKSIFWIVGDLTRFYPLLTSLINSTQI
jgi:hypothetical protein